MFLNSMRLRAMFMGVGLVALLVYFSCGGKLPGSEAVVQIEWGMYERDFEGLQVEIDGKVAGTLKRLGAATRTGFAVKPGEHEIRVLHPEWVSEPRAVELTPGIPAMLVLDVGAQVAPDGSQQITLYFQ